MMLPSKDLKKIPGHNQEDANVKGNEKTTSALPPILNLQRVFTDEKKFYEIYRGLYTQLIEVRRKLFASSSIYEKNLKSMDIESLKKDVSSLSLKQKEYFAVLLALYQDRLDYVDIQTLRRATNKDRRTLEKLLSGCKDSKIWRRGSPEIGNLCEKKHLKMERRERVCFGPKGFFEVAARYLAELSNAASIVEKTLNEMRKESNFVLHSVSASLKHRLYIEKCFVRMKEETVEIPNFETFLSQVKSKSGKELSQHQLEEAQSAYKGLEMMRDLMEKMKLSSEQLRQAYNQTLDIQTMEKSKEYVEMELASRTKRLEMFQKAKEIIFRWNAGYFFNSLSQKPDTYILQYPLRAQGKLDHTMESLISYLDDFLFDYELRKAERLCSHLDNGIQPFLELKRSLDETVQSKTISTEIYKQRLHKLASVAERVIEEQTKRLTNMVETWNDTSSSQ